MVYEGTIQNGVVIFPSAIPLPDGTSVRVEATTVQQVQTAAAGKLDPIFKIGDLAADAGIPDLSINIDHYLYGHPKVTDAQ